MKLTIGILTMAMVVGGSTALVAVGQNPDAIDNARSVAKALQQKQANDTDAALNAAGVPAAKPAPGAPAPAVKPAVIPGSTAAAAVTSGPARPAPKPAAPAVKSQSGSAANQLQKINVVPGGNDIQIEITSSGAVAPKVSRLSSPARVLVELPDTSVATSQNKIPVGSGGVKGVRVGMDGKNPPTTSVVVDLEKALSYDVSSGPTGKFALILHTQGGSSAAQAAAKATPVAVPVTAKSTPAIAKAVPVAVAKAAPAPKAAAPVAKVTSTPTAKVADAKASPKSSTPATKVADGKAAPGKASASAKQETKIAAAKTPAPSVAAAPAIEKPAEAAKPEEKKWAMSGKRDPFFSPVIQQQGSGCSTGKKCLEINAINLRGVVKSDTGFIAVVTNNIGKAYFLHENDPVFNGYVVKITGDSIVFEETVQDKLGKTSTREVVKRIFTPAV